MRNQPTMPFLIGVLVATAVFAAWASGTTALRIASAQGGAGELSVNVSNGGGEIIPGTGTTYSIVVSNAGPDAADGVSLSLNVDPALQNEVTSCTTSSGGDCGGGHDYTLTLAAGESATVILAATVDPAARGAVSVNAQISAPAGFTDGDAGNNAHGDTDALTPQADLYGELHLDVASAQPGQAVALSLVIGNDGPSTATGQAAVFVPAEFEGAGCGSPCTLAGGQWQMSFTLAPGQTQSMGASASVSADAVAGRVTLRSDAVAGEADPNPANNTLWKYLDILVPPQLALSLSNGGDSTAPGAWTTYHLSLFNLGPADTPVALTLNLPPELIGVTWVCVTGCTGGGTGAPSLTMTVGAGGTVQIDITGQVSPAATGPVVVTANAQPQVPGGGATASDRDTLPAAPTATSVPPTATSPAPTATSASINAPATEVPTETPPATPTAASAPPTATKVPPTAAPGNTSAPTATATLSPSQTATGAPTVTGTITPTATATKTLTPTPTWTPTATPTWTPLPSPTPTPTEIPVTGLTARPDDSGRGSVSLLWFAGLLALVMSPLPVVAAVHDARPRVIHSLASLGQIALARQTHRRLAPPQPRARPLTPRLVRPARAPRALKGTI